MAILATITDQLGNSTPIENGGSLPAQDAQAVRVAAGENDVTLCRDGDDLLVDFAGGEQLRLEGFYAEDGQTPLFYLQGIDGNYAPHDVPEAQDACAVPGAGAAAAGAGAAGSGA
ncbi:hypothetical protein, partial [Nitratireductor sp. GCM10026969]|uniref:hypothetical protein n=1 Tax=Nitratireductor sp. GCM10026969 TaxID=3252645 RepID=UPI00360D4596